MAAMRIGYSSQVPDMSHPADRRRLIYWAQKRGHLVTQHLKSPVDVIVLSGRSDFAKVSEYQAKAPVIIDLIDGYLGNENPIVDLARGLGKIGTSQLSGKPKRYSSALSQAITQANATICASVEQNVPIGKITKNSHVILDFHEEFPFVPFLENTKLAKQLMWEGQAFTADGLKSLQKVFSRIIQNFPLALNLVTDLETPRVLGRYGKKSTLSRVGDLPKLLGQSFKLTPWSVPNVISAARDSHISIIPLDPKNVLNPMKPENRLLIMWRLGLPCLTSSTLAYERVMRDAELNSICRTDLEWQGKLEELISSPSLRRENVQKGQAYIHEKHSETETLKRWDKAIESVL
jgi:hypothetical protein